MLAALQSAPIADSYPKGPRDVLHQCPEGGGLSLTFDLYASIGVAPGKPQTWLVCAAYGVVGIGAAAYSPARVRHRDGNAAADHAGQGQ